MKPAQYELQQRLVERRDLEAREMRDQLAVLLRRQPRDLARIGRDEAQAMVTLIGAERAANLERP